MDCFDPRGRGLLVYGAIRCFRGDWSSAGVDDSYKDSAWSDDADDDFDDASVGDVDDDD